MITERAWFTIDEINEWADRYLAKQKEEAMTEEDEEFNRIEREASLRKAAVHAAVTKKEWIGLTEQELESAYWDHMEIATQNGFEKAVKALEAKLKEKNNG